MALAHVGGNEDDEYDADDNRLKLNNEKLFFQLWIFTRRVHTFFPSHFVLCVRREMEVKH